MPSLARRDRALGTSREAAAMRRGREEEGQAAGEYVALIALVGTVLALAAGLTSGGLAAGVLAGLQRGLCEVAAVACPRLQHPRADLPPCVLARGTRVERLSETIAFVRLATSGTLSAARASDGRVTVTLADGSEAGAELGVGVRLGLAGAHAGAGGDATWASGRSWTFADAGAARRFVAAYGAKATIGGKLVDHVRSTCSLLCDALGWRPHPQLPPPDETYREGGAVARLAARLGQGEVVLSAGALLGRRMGRTGDATWYLQLDAAATAALGLGPVTLAGAAAGNAVLGYELDARGRPRRLTVQLAGELAAGGGVGGGGATVGAGGGRLVEVEAVLDLADPAARAALREPRALGRLLARARVDRRVYAVRERAVVVGGELALGLAVGGAFERTTTGLRLLSAETRLPGLPFLPRDDCRRG